MGYTDGPSMYQFGGYSPVNFGDPLGLYRFLLPVRTNKAQRLKARYETARRDLLDRNYLARTLARELEFTDDFFLLVSSVREAERGRTGSTMRLSSRTVESTMHLRGRRVFPLASTKSSGSTRMTSTSVSRYTELCRTFFDSVRRQPRMFFAKLADLETLMHGHGLAFLQLGIVTDRLATFNESFGDWLAVRRGSSVAAGWAVAVEELAKAKGVDPVGLFFELAEEFMDSWVQPDEHNSG